MVDPRKLSARDHCGVGGGGLDDISLLLKKQFFQCAQQVSKLPPTGMIGPVRLGLGHIYIVHCRQWAMEFKSAREDFQIVCMGHHF